MTAPATRLASDDRSRFEECGATADVTVVHDELRAALDALRYAIDRQADRVYVARRFTELDKAFREAPTAEVAECPGRMLLIESGVWHGQVTETRRCDVCGRQVSS